MHLGKGEGIFANEWYQSDFCFLLFEITSAKAKKCLHNSMTCGSLRYPSLLFPVTPCSVLLVASGLHTEIVFFLKNQKQLLKPD